MESQTDYVEKPPRKPIKHVTFMWIPEDDLTPKQLVYLTIVSLVSFFVIYLMLSYI